MTFSDFSDEQLIGMDVLVTHRRGGRQLTKIEKCTKKQIVCANATRIVKNTGRVIGSDIWYSTTVKLITKDEAEELRKEFYQNNKINELKEEATNKINELLEFVKKTTSLEELQEILDTINKCK